MLLPIYLAVRVADNVESAQVSDAGLVAGRRGVPMEGPELPFDLPRMIPEAFIWREGKIVFHNTAFRFVAGPNGRGQVALGGPTGLFLWQDGRITRCTAKPVLGTIDLADDGSVRVIPYVFDLPSRRIKATAPPWIWPNDAPGARTLRGDLLSFRAQDGTIVTFRPDGSKDAYGNPNGLYTVHAPEEEWSMLGPRYSFKVQVARGGQILVVPFQGTARVGSRGRFTSLDALPEFSAPNAVNASGEVVGTLADRAVLWKNGAHRDLGEAAAGPRLDEAVSISDSGIVLAMTVDHIPTLRGGTLFLLRRR